MLSSEFNSDIFAIQSWMQLRDLDIKDNLLLVENSLDPNLTNDRIISMIETHNEEI
jgi:kynureninase